MRIAVVGAGALGLYYGAMLQKGGNDVHFLLRRDYEAISAKGLTVYSVNGDFHLPHVRGYRTSEEIGTVDLVVVGLKTFANHLYQELIAPLVGETTIILTLQNGLGNEEALAGIFGAERVMGGVAFLCSNRGESGAVHHLGAGRILLGEFSSCGMDRVERIAELFCAAGVECQGVTDLKKARWEKLIWNIPFNGTCALLLKPVDTLLRHDGVRAQIRAIMAELIETANAQGLTVPLQQSFADSMIRFSETLGAYKPSMQIDREEGRQLELEAIFDKPLMAAREKGLAMPRVEELYALLDLASSE